MNKARIRINGLAAVVHWDSSVGFDRSALLVPGIPYLPAEDAITPYLVSLGYGVVLPQYIGTFDSDGQFTPEGCIETLLTISRLLAESPTLFDLRAERNFQAGPVRLMVAHSFGTYAAIGAVLRGLSVPRLVCFSPMFEFGAHRDHVGLQIDVHQHVRHMSRALPLTLRMASTDQWDQFFSDRRTFHPDPDDASRVGPTKLLAVCGDSDPSLDVQKSQRFVTEFTTKYRARLELEEYLVVESGTHDLSTLMTPEVRAKLLA